MMNRNKKLKESLNTRQLRAVGCGLLITALILVMAGCSSGKTSDDYEKAYQIGLDAYVYGAPLIETDRTFHLMTDAGAANGAPPINQFVHNRTFNNADSKTVVAPGANGLSSIAWLDLTDGPQVLHIPHVTDHYFVMALLNPYTEDLCNLGTANNTPPGDYVICGPNQKAVLLPPGIRQINVDYNRIWVIGSIQVKGLNDIHTVNEIQNGFTITPLSKLSAQKQASENGAAVVANAVAVQKSGLAFYDNLCKLLAQFPPSSLDAALLKTLEGVGIGPGRIPSMDQTLSGETKKGLIDAVADGPEKMKAVVKSAYATSAKKHHGYFLGGFGNYGTNYELRAAVATIGLGAMSSEQTIFALTMTDQSMVPLNGSLKYTMHLDQLPPATEGWSITVYDTSGALIGNPYNRYQFNDASNLSKNPDGSVDIYFQATKPIEAAAFKNWLPIGNGKGFQVMFRLLAPQHNQIKDILHGTGWQPSALVIKN
jgi:hypothetical protein